MVCVIALVVTADFTPSTPEARRLFGLWRLRYVALAVVLFATTLGVLLALFAGNYLSAYLVSTFSLVLTFGFLEMLGQVGAVSWPALFAPGAGQFGRLGTVREPHRDVRGETYQDTASAWGLPNPPIEFHYRTDRYGFRNDQDRATADIILLGDSILVGALVPSAEVVSSILEKRTHRSVMQAALIGLSPQAQHAMLWETGIDVRGKIVVQFIFEGNDLLDSRAYRLGAEGGREGGRGLLVDQVWQTLTRFTDSQEGLHGLDVCAIGSRIYTFLWTRRSFEGVEDEAAVITDAVDVFRNEIAHRGGRYMLVFVPTKLRVLAEFCAFPDDSAISNYEEHLTPLRSHVLDWGRRVGVPVLDLTEPLEAATRAGHVPWHWGDTHWNGVGHATAAEALHRWQALGGAR